MKLKKEKVMKLKKDVTINTDGFWYDLFEGGYITPEEVLEDQEDIDKVNDAISVLEDFKEAVEEITFEI